MMTDKDKIIKAIKCRAERNKRCGNPCEETGNCHYAKCMVGLDGEPYYPFVCDTEQLCTDALSLLKEQDAVEKDKECNEDKIAVECLNAIQTINKYIDDEEDEYGCTYWKDKKGYSFHADIGYFFEGLDNFEEYLMKRLGQKEKWE